MWFEAKTERKKKKKLVSQAKITLNNGTTSHLYYSKLLVLQKDVIVQHKDSYISLNVAGKSFSFIFNDSLRNQFKRGAVR